MTSYFLIYWTSGPVTQGSSSQHSAAHPFDFKVSLLFLLLAPTGALYVTIHHYSYPFFFIFNQPNARGSQIAMNTTISMQLTQCTQLRQQTNKQITRKN